MLSLIISVTGTLTLESAGTIYGASTISSKPTTETCSGTLTPS